MAEKKASTDLEMTEQLAVGDTDRVDTDRVDPGHLDTIALVAGGGELADDKTSEVHAAGIEKSLQTAIEKAGADVDAPPEVGEQLGRYEVLRELGRGGMGVVYEAHDPDLNRKVALKVLRGDVFSVEGRTRLIREAQMMARLSHPNVVTVYEVGSARTQLYIAMEFVEGVTLQEWLRDGDHRWDQVLQMFGEAGRGLAAAHAEGVVHRDFKPANVLVGQDDRVRVTDFGIAHNKFAAKEPEEVDSDAATRTPTRPSLLDEVEKLDLDRELTAKGNVLGTGPYLAPEVFWGEPATAASDQFAFCIAAWRALYGAFPFPEKNIIDRMNHIVDAPPVVPDGAPRVPKKLNRILSRGLDRDPTKRYGSMGDLITEFTNVYHSRKRRLYMAGGFAAVAAVVATTWTLAGSASSDGHIKCDKGAGKIEQVWGAERQQKVQSAFGDSSYEAAGATFSIVKRELDEYAGVWATVHDSACSETQVERIRSEEVMSVRMQCLELRRLELDALVNLFSSGEEEVVASSAAAVYQLPSPEECRNAQPRSDAEPEELRSEIADVRALLADAAAHEFMGRFAKGSELAAKAEAKAEETEFLPLEAEALLTFGKLQWRAGDLLGARQSLVKAAAAAEEAHLPGIKSEAWIELVWVSGYELARVDEALAWQLFAASSLAGSDSPNGRLNARLLVNKSGTSFRQGKLAEAKGYAMEALELEKQEYGATHPIIAETHNRLAAAALQMGDYNNSKEHIDIALEIFEESTGGNHAGVAFAHNNLGTINKARGNVKLAKEHYDLAVRIGTRTTGRNHSEVAIALSNLGVLALEREDYGVAIKRMSEALEIESARLGAAHPSIVASYENLAVAHNLAGNANKAAKLCAKAQDIRSSAQRGLNIGATSELCEELLDPT